MTTAACRRSGRKHTPVVSRAQQGLMGAELARRRAGKKSRMKGITEKELVSHLKESKGKNLPKRASDHISKAIGQAAKKKRRAK